ncbi:MAG: hypothetical protein KJ000_12565 [Pirellulaceae bacterium]|nr:hypothetical protein [Pirellulaceae bacterium]
MTDSTRRLLIVLHLWVGAFYCLDGFWGVPYRTEPGFRFLVATSSISIAYGLYRSRTWTLLFQGLIFVGLFFVWPEIRLRSVSYDPIGTLFQQISIFVIVVPPFTLGVATAVMIIRSRLLRPRNGSFASHRLQLAEIASLLVLLVFVSALGDFLAPWYVGYAAERLAEQQRLDEDNERRVSRSQLDAALTELETELDNGDDLRRRELLNAVWQLREKIPKQDWSHRIANAPRNIQLAIVHDARDWGYGKLSGLLEEADLDAEARRRLTVALLGEYEGGPRRRIGALRSVSTHERIVELLIDAISDRQAVGVADRVRLAEALEEIADLSDFDPRPAIPVLEAVIADDDPKVVEVAMRALAKANKRDRDRTMP